jgi:transcriptional regulator with XRE-family HTH domain
MSQQKLGQAIGLTFQQVQKYERGTNRVGASRLFHLSKVLEVPISFFFDDMSEETAGSAAGLAESATPFEGDPMAKRETLELVRSYHRIPHAAVRARLSSLVKAIADNSEKTSK